MYYVTKKNSSTGKKFAALLIKIQVAKDARKALLEELGSNGTFIQPYFNVDGGVWEIGFDNIPDPKIWTRKNKCQLPTYSPKLNTKIGKEIQKKFYELPYVDNYDLNMCIGYDDSISRIGFNFSSEDYFGFETSKKMDVTIPKDCKEVT